MASGYDLRNLESEARERWLRPAEIWSILENYDEHQIILKVPRKPRAGTLLLYNKRVLKSFRNDGQSWRKRKRKGGKTLAEAHERLKVGNGEALSCYYAHGDENPRLQRRSYWMLKRGKDHIVLVHYREADKTRRRKRNGSLTPLDVTSLPEDSMPNIEPALTLDCDQVETDPVYVTNDDMHGTCDVALTPFYQGSGVVLDGSALYGDGIVLDSNVHGNPVTEGKTREELLWLVRLFEMLKVSGSVSIISPDNNSGPSQQAFGDVINSILDGTLTSFCTMDWIIEELLKEKLTMWLSSKSDSGNNKGCSLLREEKCILHFVSGLGFEWALQPILNCGVGINFRDARGWTALHWAAKFGREKMVAALIASGASPGLVTDPTSDYRIGQTPGAIASMYGHTGLAGYLYQFCWAVAIIDRVILRWNRRRYGLRGFENDSIIENEDDEDILKEFRDKIVYIEIDKAVSRVLLMVRSPRARHQYHRIIKDNILSEMERFLDDLILEPEGYIPSPSWQNCPQ